MFTKYAYDANGNVTVREDNGEETAAGAQAKAPRRGEYGYDELDRPTVQVDRGSQSGATDDQRITSSYFPVGWDKQQLIEDPDGAGGWKLRQKTDWTYFAGGQLRTQTTTNATGGLLERHTLHYTDLDGIYVNGHQIGARTPMRSVRTSRTSGRRSGIPPSTRRCWSQTRSPAGRSG